MSSYDRAYAEPIDFSSKPFGDEWIDRNQYAWDVLAIPYRTVLQAATAKKNRANDANAEASLNALLELPFGWDGEEAVRILQDTVARARGVLDDLKIRCRNRSGELPVPTISACPDGSIDIFWKVDAGRILLNVKPSGDADFAAKTPDGFRASGTVKHFATLVDWFVR